MYIGFACMALYLYNIYYYPCRSRQKKLRICLLLTRVRRALPTLRYRSWSCSGPACPSSGPSFATAPSSAAPTCATAGPCSACPRSAAGPSSATAPSSAAPTCATVSPCSAGSSSATAPLASAPPLPPAPPVPLLAHALLAPAPPLAPAPLLPPAPPLAPAPWGIWPHPYWGPLGARTYRRLYYKFIITTNVF